MKNEDLSSRRRFLRTATTIAAIAAMGPLVSPARAGEARRAAAVLTLKPGPVGRIVPPQLIGLSYETLQMHNPAFFSAGNQALIGLLRWLNPQGVLRIGGNTSDYAVWSEYRGSLPTFQQLPHALYQRPYVVTPEQLSRLADFLRATGWRLIFGVNAHRGSPAMAAQLAQAVKQAVGDRLEAIQIGNEPNEYRHDDGRIFSVDDYMALWRQAAQTIRQQVRVPLAGPDTGANTDWVLRFAEQAEDIVALSRHYYRGGAPEPTTSIAQLLAGDPGFLDEVARIARVARARQRPFWLTEVNSYWGGGKLGVSNTFASALWGGDFALACAQAGVDGINIHSGVLSVLEASLDKNAVAAPSDAGYRERIDAISGRYTPIAGDVGAGFYARPLYYGLLLAQQFGGGQFIDTALNADGSHLTAYAAAKQGRRLLAVFNKDMQRDVDLRVEAGAAALRARVWRLQAPSLEDVHEVRFAGCEVGSAGEWSPRHEEVVPVSAGSFTLHLPRGSAALVFVEA